MKIRQFLSVVPKSVKLAAAIVFSCAVIIGPVVGFINGASGAWDSAYGVPSVVLASAAGFGVGLLGGALIAIWLLCLGYVYADARRRAMPAVLWTLIAILVPNLLGFLLYFALRRPIASACAHCGQPIAAQQRFCSWCGSQGASVPPGEDSFRSSGSGLDSPTAI